ncbi:MAG: BRO family protein [Candidatus Woesebacteria bacterium]|nr:BRO family protein [Candidatus Woesebacteria bacterium]
MSSENNKLIAIFEEHPVRRTWDEKQEKWYFSVIDIIAILTGSSIPKRYWADLKKKLKTEGSQVYENIVQLKLLAKDGKKYLADVADVEAIFRLVQSVPSPKAEPLKLWLAKVGYERMQETVDPELSISRGRKNWQLMGRSQKWVEQRMLSVETRNKLTDYWSDHGIEKGEEFAKLTNVIHQEWSGLSVKSHKNIKKLKTQNLRDHMSEAELIFTALAELSTRQISETEKAEGYGQNEVAAHKGGRISGNARKELEQQTGKKVVNSDNYLPNKKEPKKLK